MHKQFVPRLVSIVTATTAIMWMSGVALPSAQRSETEGIKEAENFVSAGSDTVGAVGKARVQIEKTLAAYNSLVTQPTKDMKGDYKKLMDGAKDTDQKVDDARERVKKMEAAGDVYFAGREAAIKEIQSQELRDKDGLAPLLVTHASLQDAGQSLQTLRTDLKNQITYLGSDLTPSAMTSLKPQAQKFNARGTEVLTKVDQTMATANKYFDSMRPTKS